MKACALCILVYVKKIIQACECSNLFHHPNTVILYVPVLGFALVWDNVQKLVRSRDHSKDKGNKMLLWANGYAVLNRVESIFTGVQNTLSAVDVPLSQFLHNTEDADILRRRMTTLISRIIVQHIPHFNALYKDVVTWHIQHPYFETSKTKSQMVGYDVYCVS